MQISSLFHKVTEELKDSPGVVNAAYEARLILEHFLGKTQTQILCGRDDVTHEMLALIDGAVQRRKECEPLAYVLQRQWFYGRRFAVVPGVFIPRPETELLVERAIQIVKSTQSDREKLIFADWGCGTGVIGITCALELPQSQVHMIDVSETALENARKNAQEWGVIERVTLLRQDLDAGLDETSVRFDFVLANPPYIDRGDSQVDPWVRAFEPHEALFSAEQGLRSIRRWLAAAQGVLKPGGYVGVEHGWQQGETVKYWMESLGFDSVTSVFDYQGYWRHTFGRKLG